MSKKARELTGSQKAAILLISLGPDAASSVYKHLNEEEIESLTLEISAVRKVEKEAREKIFEEFQTIALAQDYISHGGISYANSVLEKALGPDEAKAIVNRLTSSLHVKPFDFAKKADPMQLFTFIQDEHPQTIALILSYLHPQQAGKILSALPHDIQTDIARRIAVMESTSPEVISEIEAVLERKLSSSVQQDYSETGGIEAIVEVLNGVDRATEKTILDSLEIQDPELAEEIKKRMFVFEDIVTLDNRSIQRVIRDSPNEDLLLSMKVSAEDVKEVLFRNMSQRMAESFRDEMEVMGPVRLRDVEEAQSNIVAVIRRLEEAGDIIVARGGGDDVIV
ncbi:flagellar motor switch protein FliG [Jeotgalibacillus sp. S-D1]|uniref:flagellar motor switch protein FliG n=1 Tax=Jeotgalibacillus sp. S-D1 TaxID=2552189 RepID=UPI001059F2C9|nr:flagellar motor switch protein FliG [Jeotgalibacillus sp. S-D1]TDL35045.1 flagellar motor switch protein FliG [Jeotgalibacillus sp. S-D1]